MLFSSIPLECPAQLNCKSCNLWIDGKHKQLFTSEVSRLSPSYCLQQSSFIVLLHRSQRSWQCNCEHEAGILRMILIILIYTSHRASLMIAGDQASRNWSIPHWHSGGKIPFLSQHWLLSAFTIGELSPPSSFILQAANQGAEDQGQIPTYWEKGRSYKALAGQKVFCK